MFKKIEERNIKVGPSQAEKILKHNVLSFQRPLKHSWVNELANIMSEGKFTTGRIAYAQLEYDGGRCVLADGQHQCRAIIDSGVTVDVVFTRYAVYDPFDLSELYRSLDNGVGRTTADYLRPESVALNISWPPRIQALVVTAAKIREGNIKMKKREAVKLLQTYIEQGDFINTIMTSAKGPTPKHLYKGPIACVMMTTWEKSHRDAAEFWVQVRDGEGLKQNMPSYQLREYLKNTIACRGNGSRGYKRIASEHEIAARCITAWNAYRKNLPTRLSYYADKPIPKVI